MVREYGKDRAAIIAVRVTEQEKEQIKKAAEACGVSISGYVRSIIKEYLEEDKKQ